MPGTDQPGTTVSVRQSKDGHSWELLHPPCVAERTADIEEVQLMLDAGETDVARDELRWLLAGCGDFILAHRLLGEIALEAGDLRLARGHFGYAYKIGTDALPPGGLPGPLAYTLPANQPFLESAKGLAWCLRGLGKSELAKEVLERLLALDLTDPLGARALHNEMPS